MEKKKYKIIVEYIVMATDVKSARQEELLYGFPNRFTKDNKAKIKSVRKKNNSKPTNTNQPPIRRD